MLRRAKHPYDNNYDYDTSTTTITDIDILLSGGMVSTSRMKQCDFGTARLCSAGIWIFQRSIWHGWEAHSVATSHGMEFVKTLVFWLDTQELYKSLRRHIMRLSSRQPPLLYSLSMPW